MTIKPSHAISIWISKDILYVELPHADGAKGQAHLLRLPNNVWRLTQALNIVKARHESSQLGTKGDPTQAQSETAIKEMQRKAAGYTGPITKEVKVPVSTELSSKVKDAIRMFINV